MLIFGKWKHFKYFKCGEWLFFSGLRHDFLTAAGEVPRVQLDRVDSSAPSYTVGSTRKSVSWPQRGDMRTPFVIVARYDGSKNVLSHILKNFHFTSIFYISPIFWFKSVGRTSCHRFRIANTRTSNAQSLMGLPDRKLCFSQNSWNVRENIFAKYGSIAPITCLS